MKTQTTILYRAALDLNTSFSGTDLLKIRLDTGSNRGDDNGGIFWSRSAVSWNLNRPDPVSSGLVGCTIPLPYEDFSVTLGRRFSLQTTLTGIGMLTLAFWTLQLRHWSTTISSSHQWAQLRCVGEWNPDSGPFKARAMYVAANAANPNNRG